MRRYLGEADAIASDREQGASQLAARLWPVLDEARAEGLEATVEVARRVCLGQPAMAALWNICAVAVSDFDTPGRYTQVRAEVQRAGEALVRAASLALAERLPGRAPPQILTISYSNSVVRTLRSLAASHPLEVICAESRPGSEGVRTARELADHDLRTHVVEDAALTTFLPTAAAVVAGADAVAERHWTNKAGTFGIAAAAWFAGVPVFVVVGREKAEATLLSGRLTLPRLFERIPTQLATQFLTERGPIPPESLPELTDRFAEDLRRLCRHLPASSSI